MDKALKLKAFRNAKYEMTETDTDLQVPFVVLKANEEMTPSVNGAGLKTVFSKQTLQTIANKLKGKPVLADHFESVNNIVGVIADTEIKEDYLIAHLKFPKVNEKLISLLKLKPSPINQVSIGGYIKAYEEDTEKELITIKEFEPVEVSLVINGASLSTKRLDAKKFNQEVKNMEEVKKLQEENLKLKSSIEEKDKKLKDLQKQLEEAQKEAKELKAELDSIELEKYKAEKLAEIPSHLQAVAKPALSVAPDKKAIDQIVEEYKKLSASQTKVMDVPEPQTQTQEENPFLII